MYIYHLTCNRNPSDCHCIIRTPCIIYPCLYRLLCKCNWADLGRHIPRGMYTAHLRYCRASFWQCSWFRQCWDSRRVCKSVDLVWEEQEETEHCDDTRYTWRACGLHLCGLHSCGLHVCGLHSCGLHVCGLHVLVWTNTRWFIQYVQCYFIMWPGTVSVRIEGRGVLHRL